LAIKHKTFYRYNLINGLKKDIKVFRKRGPFMNIKDIKLGGDKTPNRVLYMLRSDLSDRLFLTVYAGMASATAKNVGGRPKSSIHQL
jgi:hypothetical protein